MTRNVVQCNCPSCGSTTAIVEPGTGPHVARLTCSECDRFIRWIGKKELTAIEALATVFGGGNHG
jgi:transposase-like protein